MANAGIDGTEGDSDEEKRSAQSGLSVRDDEGAYRLQAQGRTASAERADD